MAMHRTPHTGSHGPNATMVMGLIALVTLLIGALLITFRTPAVPAVAPAVAPAAPAAPAVAPAVPAAPAQSNRFFADEIAGSHTAIVDPATLLGPQAEHLQGLSRPAAAPAARVVPLTLPSLSNHFFADEIATGAGPAIVAPEVPIETSGIGPR